MRDDLERARVHQQQVDVAGGPGQRGGRQPQADRHDPSRAVERHAGALGAGHEVGRGHGRVASGGSGEGVGVAHVGVVVDIAAAVGGHVQRAGDGGSSHRVSACRGTDEGGDERRARVGGDGHHRLPLGDGRGGRAQGHSQERDNRRQVSPHVTGTLSIVARWRAGNAGMPGSSDLTRGAAGGSNYGRDRDGQVGKELRPARPQYWTSNRPHPVRIIERKRPPRRSTAVGQEVVVG